MYDMMKMTATAARLGSELSAFELQRGMRTRETALTPDTLSLASAPRRGAQRPMAMRGSRACGRKLNARAY